MKGKQKLTNFQFQIPLEFDRQFRSFVVSKYGGYHKGVFQREIILAITNLMESENKK